jgi:ankyrin repeat protein
MSKYVLNQMLVSAVSSGDAASARLALDAGADPGADSGDERMGGSLLHVAAKQKNAKMLSLLAGAGAHVDARDAMGKTALHLCASAGFAEGVDALLEKGASLEAADEFGATPVMFAAMRGADAMVDALVARGADVLARSRAGKGASDYARGHAFPKLAARLDMVGRAAWEASEICACARMPSAAMVRSRL